MRILRLLNSIGISGQGANLWLRYADLNPAETSRNFIRRFYDVSGDLYEVFGSRNEARQFLGELTIKF